MWNHPNGLSYQTKYEPDLQKMKKALQILLAYTPEETTHQKSQDESKTA